MRPNPTSCRRFFTSCDLRVTKPTSCASGLRATKCGFVSSCFHFVLCSCAETVFVRLVTSCDLSRFRVSTCSLRALFVRRMRLRAARDFVRPGPTSCVRFRSFFLLRVAHSYVSLRVECAPAPHRDFFQPRRDTHQFAERKSTTLTKVIVKQVNFANTRDSTRQCRSRKST